MAKNLPAKLTFPAKVDTPDRAMREDVRHAEEEARKLTPEQKADAVRMFRELGNLPKVARDLGAARVLTAASDARVRERARGSRARQRGSRACSTSSVRM
jgi:hypothetical protein